MKTLISVLSLVLFVQFTIAQKPIVNEFPVIDKVALKLPDSLSKTTEDIARYMNANFKTESEKTRGIFAWVATNIQYDVENMYALNFYESKEEKIAKPLRTRKGICENFAALFTDICSKSGVKSVVVEGYTKQNGARAYLPHAWSAARIDASWFLFDPTWGSGYVNAGKFHKKINNDYFRVSPSTFIKSHMPFDYLWQFLEYPITNQEFSEGKAQQNNAKTYFNYSDSILAYEKGNYIEQVKASAYRVEKNGVTASLVFDRLQHLKLEIERDRQNQIVNLYNGAVADYNEGISHFNHYINYRNRQFTPQKTDPEIQSMIDSADNKLREAKIKLGEITNPDANTARSIAELSKGVQDATAQVREQKEWLKVYFSKGKSGRKRMFYEKITLFGIKVN